MCRRFVDLVEPELQPARDGGGAEREPLVEQVAQAHAPCGLPSSVITLMFTR